MKLLVTLKRTPQRDARIRISEAGDSLDLDNVQFEVNPFDALAVEEALRIREAGAEVELVVVTVGGEECQQQLISALAMGADWCNAARAFMFSIGCVQSQSCHTNTCPVGVATQDARLGRALNVSNKSERAYHFHRNTVGALAEVVAAAGLDDPTQLCPDHIFERRNTTEVHTLSRIYNFIEPGQLLKGGAPEHLQDSWNSASARSF